MVLRRLDYAQWSKKNEIDPGAPYIESIQKVLLMIDYLNTINMTSSPLIWCPSQPEKSIFQATYLG